MSVLVNSTRFYNHVDMLTAYQSAAAILVANPGTQSVAIRMPEIIGEGYFAGTSIYGVTRWVVVRFDDFGKCLTMYPSLEKPVAGYRSQVLDF